VGRRCLHLHTPTACVCYGVLHAVSCAAGFPPATASSAIGGTVVIRDGLGGDTLILRLTLGTTPQALSDGGYTISSPSAERATIDHFMGTISGLGAALRPCLPFRPAHPAAYEESGLSRFVALDVPSRVSLDEARSAIAAFDGLVEAVQRARIGHAMTLTSIPNDPLFGQQYALLNLGQTVDGQPGLPGADIQATHAWDLPADGAGVIIAVLDSGISESHPDLADRLLPGWNFVGNNDKTDDDYSSHGTHCAGIAAASTHNGIGIAGVAGAASILPVKVLSKYGFGTELLCGAGLVWAADSGARVASVSIGFDPAPGGDEDSFLRAAVNYATTVGTLVVASAGNTPAQPVVAPARYPNAMAVGATDNRDTLWPSSATGPEISVVAPGVGVISTWDSKHFGNGENTYDHATGTSQACPHVAGLAALIFSVDPTLNPWQVRTIIESTSDDLGAPGRDDQHGHGRINAGRAVRAAMGRSPNDAIGGHAWSCVADFNRDGTIDTRDFVAFLNAWASQDESADIAPPFGVVDSRDFIEYLNRFAAGCP